MKFFLGSLMLVTALLAGCGADPAPAPATAPAASETPASTPGAGVGAQGVVATPPTDANPTPTPDAAATPAGDATPPATVASDAAEPPVATPPADAATAAAPTAPEPREGIDYTVLDPQVLLSPNPGKIEVAEVFAYYCIHCANIQRLVTPWKAALPADVEFRYVPMAHGQSEPLARAFYAAEAMGELGRSHEALFKALAIEHKLKTGSAEEIAGFYADAGVDRDALLSTMQSFAVNAQVARNQKAVTRWAIESTPTFIVNGRYKVNITGDRGHDGAIRTIDYLIARERAAAAGTDPAR